MPTTIHRPGNGGEINVQLPKGGSSVSYLRKSFDIPRNKYAFVGRKADGSPGELDDADIVRNGESVSILPEHVAGYANAHLVL
ncbi:hypothetical protein ACFL6S_25475 [Candidatus Poribacteria bacterium]